jgi:tricorn protease
MFNKLIYLITTFVLFTAFLNAESRLLRFPDIHNDKVAFVYAGDIYIASTSGGDARQLTSHKGLELFPKFSPDGNWLAFSAEYSGIRQVYVMPADGGFPKQLTYYNSVNDMPPRGGYDYQVIGWTADSKNVIFRGNRLPWGGRMGKYYTVSIDGGLEKELPIFRGGTADISPDGKSMAFSPIDREWRTWKRYRGGRNQDIWIMNLETLEAEHLVENQMTDNMPVWIGDKIYFTSDRDYTLNLFSYDLTSKELTKVTNHTPFDVLFPSGDGKSQIVYQNGGYIYLLNTNTNETKKLDITVNTDGKYKQPRFEKLKDFISNASVLPEGNGVVFNARGEIFLVPKKNGRTYNLTKTPGTREINAEVSPDGKKICYYSDATGEYEIYTMNADGSDKKQLTKNTNIWMFPPLWSPDSKKIAFGDKNQKLRILDVASGKITDADRAKYDDITYYNWSPDSKWLTYSKRIDNYITQIFVYSLTDNKVHKLGSGFSNDANPVFTEDGDYIVFTSERDFNLEFSAYEFDYLYTNATRIYAAALNNEVPPFKPYKNDLIEELKEDNKDDDRTVSIEPDGFADRVVALPVSDGNYTQLSTAEGKILYMTGGKLMSYDIKKQESDEIISGISMYSITPDSKKLLYGAGRDFGIIDLAPAQEKSNMDLSGLEMKVYPELEYQQIFHDAYRITRDWFYDPDMHGYDWKAIYEKYKPLVAHVERRNDLDFIIGEFFGELNAGHCYVNGGDEPDLERIESGLLGCRFEDTGDKYYKIQDILKGENWHESFRSPLDEFGVNIKEGDYLISIDGEEVTTSDNPYKFLENKGNKIVVIEANTKPSKDGAKSYEVKTITAEYDLMAYDWVRKNREMVDKMSDGKIGYIWLPNTLFEGNRELYKWFYPQTTKDALIIDDRYNGGGFIPTMMIKLLERKTLNFWDRRGTQPTPDPLFSHDGPKTTLINGYSSSGGDAFPYYFRTLGLGKLIGQTTWGGLIGISGNPQFIDGGGLNVPTFRIADTEGNWMIENEGVKPDIEVMDRPDEIANGKEPILEAAVKHLMEELKKNPVNQRIEKPIPPDESK